MIRIQVIVVRRIRGYDTSPRDSERARSPPRMVGIEDTRSRDSGGDLRDVEISSGQTEFALDTTLLNHFVGGLRLSNPERGQQGVS